MTGATHCAHSLPDFHATLLSTLPDTQTLHCRPSRAFQTSPQQRSSACCLIIVPRSAVRLRPLPAFEVLRASGRRCSYESCCILCAPPMTCSSNIPSMTDPPLPPLVPTGLVLEPIARAGVAVPGVRRERCCHRGGGGAARSSMVLI